MQISDLPEFDIMALQGYEYPADGLDWSLYPDGLAQSSRGLEVLGYDVMTKLYRSTDFVDPMEARMEILGFPRDGIVYKALTGIMSATEGDDHRRMRRAFQPWFLADNVERYRSYVRNEVDKWMVKAAQQETTDFVGELGRFLPASIFTQILGADAKDTEFIARASAGILRFSSFNADERTVVEDSLNDTFAWVDDLLAYKADHRDNDLSSALLKAEEEGTITREHTLRIILSLVAGSTESTTTQMARNLATLAGHKDQWQLLKKGEATVSTAVSELIRFNPGGLSTGRAAAVATTFEGIEFEAGQTVYVNRFAGSNDPSAYENPRTLDVTNDERRASFTFGHGRHACVGRTIAVIEQEEVVASALEHWDDFEIAAVEWQGFPYILFPVEMRVAATAA